MAAFILLASFSTFMMFGLPVWEHSKEWSTLPSGLTGIVVFIILAYIIIRHINMRL